MRAKRSNLPEIGLKLARSVALALLVLAAPLAESRAEPGAAGPLAGAAGLRPFFQGLANIERHRALLPLRILQIGDSHTANDSFSGRLRERLQERFGAAGRGWLPAGIPFAYSRPALVTVTESGWRHLRAKDGTTLALGLDGVAAEAVEPGAWMTLASSEPEGFDRLAVEYLARPGGAPLTVRIDRGAALTVPTGARTATIRRFEKLLSRPARDVELAASQPGAALLGWAVERRRSGILYENHGTIGATVGLLEKLSPAAVDFELRERRPGLLVIAFGTNEGFAASLDPGGYAARFRQEAAALRRRAPGAAVLVLGPPDGNRLSPACGGQAAAATDCSAIIAEGSCSWTEPGHLAAVRDIQRRVARQQGWAFWDWSAAMGGQCSIDRWLHDDPPLAMPDHVHLNKAGYAATADALFTAVMKEYDAWKHERRPMRRR